MAHFAVFGCHGWWGAMLHITLTSDILLWTIDWYVVRAEEFQQYMLGEIALPANDNLSNSGLELDSSTASRTPQSLSSILHGLNSNYTSAIPQPALSHFLQTMRSNQTPTPSCNSSSSSSSWAPLSMVHMVQLSKNLTHWSILATRPPGPAHGGVAIVDLSQAESVHWPLIHGLALASREYRTQLGKDPPKILSETYGAYPFSPSYHYNNDKKVITDFLIRPINPTYTELKKAKKQRKKKNTDLERGHAAQSIIVPHAFLVVHGLHNNAHTEKVYEVACHWSDKSCS
ncbi:hypothetical protein B0H14DRAFT_2634360 [Mycena olivaceomarginata]|nr:hypothetical protein B0H14DRAFT_2634360 [Mycena olivaceomarginata]